MLPHSVHVPGGSWHVPRVLVVVFEVSISEPKRTEDQLGLVIFQHRRAHSGLVDPLCLLWWWCLWCEIVAESGMGFLSEPGNLKQLEENILSLSLLNQEEYNQFVQNCQEIAQKKFDFNFALSSNVIPSSIG